MGGVEVGFSRAEDHQGSKVACREVLVAGYGTEHCHREVESPEVQVGLGLCRPLATIAVSTANSMTANTNHQIINTKNLAQFISTLQFIPAPLIYI